MPTITVPLYAKGNNVSLMTVKAASAVSSAGVLTIPADANANNLHLLGVFDSFEFEGTLKLEENSAADALVENYMPLKDGFSVTIGEIMPASGISVLLTKWGTSTYFRAACRLTIDGVTASTADQIFIVVFIRESCGFAVVEGKDGVKLTGKPCGILPYYGPESAATI